MSILLAAVAVRARAVLPAVASGVAILASAWSPLLAAGMDLLAAGVLGVGVLIWRLLADEDG